MDEVRGERRVESLELRGWAEEGSSVSREGSKVEHRAGPDQGNLVV